MSPELKTVNQQTCFNLINGYLGRDLRESEILGLKKLVDRHGAVCVQEYVGRLVSVIKASVPKPKHRITLNNYLRDYEKGIGIDTWIGFKIEDDKSRMPVRY